MSLIQSQAPARGTLLFCCVLALGVMGCGVDQYETRLKLSKDYYNYLNKIEQNLEPKWSDGRVVEMIRVPKHFQPILPPVPVKNEDGTEEVGVDARQPDYMNLVFPTAELVGAWEAPFSVVVSDGSTDTRKAYIYVLSNYWKFLGEDPAEALKFTDAMVQLVGDALEDHIPPDKLENPTIEPHPKKGLYLPESLYKVYTFRPKAIKQRSTERESTVDYAFNMYALSNANIQAIVLVVVPEGTSSQEKLNERIAMMLEHFRITKTEPKPSQGQSGGAAPANPTGF